MQPIGIFDSGVGGISLLLELHKRAPHIPIVYLADTARFPYGTKTAATLYTYAREIAQFFLQQGISQLLCGCNAASSAALPQLSEELHIPIIGVIEPVVRHLATTGTCTRIGLMGTEATVRIGKHKALLATYRSDITCIPQACPELAPAVESGLLHKEQLLPLLTQYVTPLLDAQVDAILLACTHYSFVKHVLREMVPEEIAIIDPAEQCTQAFLQQTKCSTNLMQQPSPIRYCVTGSTTAFSSVMQKLMPETPYTIEHIHL